MGTNMYAEMDYTMKLPCSNIKYILKKKINNPINTTEKQQEIYWVFRKLCDRSMDTEFACKAWESFWVRHHYGNKTSLKVKYISLQ